MNILFIDNGTASWKWRIEGAAKRINELTEQDGVYITPSTSWNEDIAGADIVVFELIRNSKAVDQAHAQGAKVIYEADDAFIDSYKDNRKNLTKLTPEIREQTLETILKCDAMTVTTETLKENYARFFKGPIYVLPNYVDLTTYNLEKKPERNTNEIRLGWFGSMGHLEDLQMVTLAIKRVLEENPEVKFVYAGFGGMSSDKKYTQIGWGEDIFKDIPRSRREFYTGVSENYWNERLRNMGLDIGIAPLIDDYFNKCKSHIKWMEYAMDDTAAVVSKVLYKDYVEDGKTALVAVTEEDWYNHLTTLIRDEKKRKEIALNAKKEVVSKWSIDDHWKDWLSVYSEVLKS